MKIKESDMTNTNVGYGRSISLSDLPQHVDSEEGNSLAPAAVPPPQQKNPFSHGTQEAQVLPTSTESNQGAISGNVGADMHTHFPHPPSQSNGIGTWSPHPHMAPPHPRSMTPTKTSGAQPPSPAGMISSPIRYSPFGRRQVKHRRDVKNRVDNDESTDDEDAAEARKRGGLARGKFDSNDPDLDIDTSLDKIKPPIWHTRLFWTVSISLFVSLWLFVAGACLLAFNSDSRTSSVQVWRLFFFLGGLPIIWWIGDIVTRAIVWSVEKAINVKNALFFVYRVRKPLSYVVRSCLATGLWALVMLIDSDTLSSAVRGIYITILKVWGCLSLFTVANLLKNLLAKMMTLKFHKKSHYTKMQDALKHEYWLRALLQKRPELPCPDDGDFNDEGGYRSDGIGESVRQSILSSFKKMKRSQSTGQMGSLMFWRRSSAPLPKIEDSSSSSLSVELSKSEMTLPPPPPTDAKESGEGVGSPPSVKIQITGSGSPLSQSPPVAHAAMDPLPKLPHVRLTRGGGDQGSRQDATPRAPCGMTPPSRQHSHLPVGSEASFATLGNTTAAGYGIDNTKVPRNELMSKMANLERYIRKNTLEVTFRDALNQVTGSEMTSETDAKRVAYYLFWNIMSEFDKSFIEQSDLLPFLPEDEVPEAFEMLDADRDGHVTVDECVIAIQNIFQDRRNLATSLQDTRSITSVLETLIGVVLHVIFVFFYLLIFQANVSQLWVSFSGVILAFSFMFGNSVRQTYENVVFLFGVHPYDIGDRLFFNGEVLIVDEIAINFTTCSNLSNQKVWMPNQSLLNSSFINLSASGNKWEGIKVLVDIDTPATVLDELDASLQALLQEYPKEFEFFGVSLKEAAVPMKMTIQVGYQFLHSGIDVARTVKARTVVHVRVAQVLSRLGVQYTWPAFRAHAHVDESNRELRREEEASRAAVLGSGAAAVSMPGGPRGWQPPAPA